MLNTNQARKIRAISYQLESIMNSFGYSTVEMPIIENSELFLTKAGDQVIEKLFTFERNGRQLSLRPEFTAAAAYHYATHADEPVVRWQFHGAIFEEYPQGDIAEYQKYSIGAELIGTRDIAADVEIILLAIQGIISQNISDWTLKIGHAGVLREALSRFSLDDRTERFILNHRNLIHDGGMSAFQQMLDQYLPQKSTNLPDSDDETLTQMLLATLGNGQTNNTLGGRTREDIAARILRKHKQVSERQQVNDVIDLLKQWADINGEPTRALEALCELFPESSLVTQWQDTIKHLASYDIPLDHIVIQPDLVRNWDYYTGIVFEIVDGEGRSLCGGGRYDELIGLISDKDAIPAVGFAYDATAIAETLSDTMPKNNTLFVRPQKVNTPEIWRWLALLRSNGIEATLLMPEQTVRDDSTQVTIDQSGRIIYQQNSYEFSEIDNLIAEIKNNAR